MLENIFGEISGSRFAPYLEKQEKVILKSINNVIMIFFLITSSFFEKIRRLRLLQKRFCNFLGNFFPNEVL